MPKWGMAEKKSRSSGGRRGRRALGLKQPSTTGRFIEKLPPLPKRDPAWHKDVRAAHRALRRNAKGLPLREADVSIIYSFFENLQLGYEMRERLAEVESAKLPNMLRAINDLSQQTRLQAHALGFTPQARLQLGWDQEGPDQRNPIPDDEFTDEEVENLNRWLDGVINEDEA